MEGTFDDKLKFRIHQFVAYCYDITEGFPKSELYSSASQLRRSSMSIMLNYVEGYARKRPKVKLNAYEISHGSSQESKYIVLFAYTRRWIGEDEYKKGLELVNEIGKMLWSTIEKMETEVES